MKILSILLAFVMLLTAQIPICAEGASATLTVVKSEISEKNNTLQIRLDATEAVLGGSFNLVYDSSVLEYCGLSAHSYTCQVNQNYATNQIRVTFAGNTGVTSGVIFTFSFNPLVNDSCTTSFSFENVNLYNSAAKNVETTTVGAVCDVKILKEITDMQLLTTELTLGVGEKSQIVYDLTPEDATVETVTWRSDNSSVATVDRQGVVTAVRAGTAHVECTVRDCFFGSYTRQVTVTVYQRPNLTIASGYLVPGESMTLAVRLDTVDTTYTSGSLNLTYDPTVLSLTSAVAGNLLANCMTTVNPAYREDAVRLNFLGQQGITGSGDLCLLTFTALKAGTVEISAEQVLLYTNRNKEHTANVGVGTVGVGAYSVSLQPPTEATLWKEFTADVCFSAAPGVAGGSFVVSYDAEQFLFLGYSNPMTGFSVTVNENYAPGQIKISFAGTQGVAEGTLLTLRFISKKNPAEGISTEMSLAEDSVLLYTQSGAKILPAVSHAAFTVVHNQTPPAVGDIDFNGVMDTRDATAVLQTITGASDAVLVDAFADLNGDGQVTEADMAYLMKLLAGWDPSQIA